MKTRYLLFLFLFTLGSLSSMVKVVFRVDDFQIQNDSIQEKIINTFIQNHVPLSIGVIPYNQNDYLVCNMDSSLISVWKKRIEVGQIEIALHGYNHKINSTNPFAEFVGLSLIEQERLLRLAKVNIDSVLDIKVITFVPPFNNYDSNTIKALNNTGFKILSANRNGRLLNSDLKYYPCTTEDFKDITKFKSKSNLYNGLIVVMFHPYTFIEKSFSFSDLNDLLEDINDNPNISCYTFSKLYSINEPSSKYQRRKNTLIEKFIKFNQLIILNNRIHFFIEIFNALFYCLISCLLIISFSVINSHNRHFTLTFLVTLFLFVFYIKLTPLKLLFVVLILSVIFSFILMKYNKKNKL